MAAVTQRINSFLGGVSRQSDDKKLPGQVKECINGYTDPTYGLIKRPGTEFIRNLSSNADASSDWFFIHRDNDEKYVGAIGNFGSGTYIKIWNASNGNPCTITMDGTPSPNAYLDEATTTARNYDVVTAQDTTIIVNKTKPVAVLADPSFVSNASATLMLSGSPVDTKYNISLKVGNTTYDMDEVDTSTTEYTNAGYAVSFDGVLDALEAKLESLSGFSVEKLSHSLRITRTDTAAFSVTKCTGGEQNNKLTVFQDQVDNISQLPTEGINGQVVKIINTASDKDTYFAKFVADDGSSGIGYWEETVDPSKSTGFDATTMPHELINTSTNAFTFRAIPWIPRLVGDDVTNNHPSFVGEKIQKVFFHNNRLGFLSKDSVILSQAGDFYNFYHTSAQTITESDPVDINCSTTRPAELYNVVPTAQGLVLFSKSQQFLMSGKDGLLTPSTATVNPISNFESSTDIEPIDMGTHIDFVNKQPSYSRVFSMTTKGQQDNPKIVDISRIVTEWIPGTITDIVASPQNKLLALYSRILDADTGYNSEIYLYRTHDRGEERVIESWFSWKLSGFIQFLAFDNDDFYLVTTSSPTNADDVILSKGNLSRSPEDAMISSSKGSKINPYIDLYTSPNNNKQSPNDKTLVYVSGDNPYTKCYIPYKVHSALNMEPVIIIKGDSTYFSAEDGSTNATASSGYILPVKEVVVDGDETFYKVDGDQTSLEDRMLVGVKYKFTIDLPRTYFRTDEGMTKSDYTASLVVKRVNFSLGLSGEATFRLKSDQFIPFSLSFRGDGSKTEWNWLESDFPKFIDREQISVKVDDVEQRPIPTGVYSTTGFEWINDRKIKFKQAPKAPTNTEEKNIVISLTEWDVSNPAIKADKYLADDVSIEDHAIFSIPIHQKAYNFTLKVTDNTPYPVSLNSMTWEGNYSPRFYRRT